MRGLHKHFGPTRALDGVDLDVRPGELLGLLGPNGAGKTTLVRILATLLRPTAGTVRIFGADVVDDADVVRRQISLTGQYAAVDELLTGRENLMMFAELLQLPPAAARRRADVLLERFDLTGRPIVRRGSTPAAVIGLMVVCGMLVGFRFERGLLAAIASLAVVGLFGYAFSWVFAYVALRVPGAESTQAAAFVAAFPLTFVSSVFVPTETYSIAWLAAIARWSPVTAAADAARGLAVAGPVAEPLTRTLVWSGVLLAVFIPLSVARFRRVE